MCGLYEHSEFHKAGICLSAELIMNGRVLFTVSGLRRQFPNFFFFILL
jgi:hypothetical protein